MTTNDLIDEFLRDPNAREMYDMEPQFSMQVKWLRQMLHLVDGALEGEGVGPGARDRVLRTVLGGSVERPADARHRMMMSMARFDVERLRLPGIVRLPNDAEGDC